MFFPGETRKDIGYDISGESFVQRGDVNTYIDQIPINMDDGTIFQIIIKYRGPSTIGHETAQCWRYRKGKPSGWIEIHDPAVTYMK
jgi:hypothetical protein